METDPDTRFVVDHMLIKLGKYLRILGFDAHWDPDQRTHELILRANRENRIFCTRNRRLPDQYPQPLLLFQPLSDDPVAQLQQLVGEYGLNCRRRLFTRCIRCNRDLEAVPDKTRIEGRVHPNVYARHDRFFRCPACGTVFWHGSHVANTCRKLGLAVPN